MWSLALEVTTTVTPTMSMTTGRDSDNQAVPIRSRPLIFSRSKWIREPQYEKDLSGTQSCPFFVDDKTWAMKISMMWRCPEYDTWEGNRETVNVQLHTCDYVVSFCIFWGVLGNAISPTLALLRPFFLCPTVFTQDKNMSDTLHLYCRLPTTTPTVMEVAVAQMPVMESLDNMDLVCDLCQNCCLYVVGFGLNFCIF